MLCIRLKLCDEKTGNYIKYFKWMLDVEKTNNLREIEIFTILQKDLKITIENMVKILSRNIN